MALTLIVFVAELIGGYYSGSLALIADSFHMLSDVLALAIAFYAIKLAEKQNNNVAARYSFGLQRAEVLGALINAVSLLALCFTISIEAIQRFIEPSHISSPYLVLIVGGIGLVTNVIGLVLFHEHSHAGHHDHGHHHQPPTPEPDTEIPIRARITKIIIDAAAEMQVEEKQLLPESGDTAILLYKNSHDNDEHDHDHTSHGSHHQVKNLSRESTYGSHHNDDASDHLHGHGHSHRHDHKHGEKITYYRYEHARRFSSCPRRLPWHPGSTGVNTCNNIL